MGNAEYMGLLVWTPSTTYHIIAYHIPASHHAERSRRIRGYVHPEEVLGVEPHHRGEGPRLHPDEHRRRRPRDGQDDRHLEDLRHLRRHPPYGRVRRLHQQARQEGRNPLQKLLMIVPSSNVEE